MDIKTKELNLSLKEYFYYQECPQRFRIYRIMNPLPEKEVFMKSKNRSVEEYELRGYTNKEIDGIKKHHFFAEFFDYYDYTIYKNKLPQELKNDKEKELFWNYQRRRYEKSIDEYPWKPVETEMKIMTEKQRGIIDSVEFSNSNTELRIVDYKRKRHKTDREAIYFYVKMLDSYIIDKAWDGIEISELGHYYYHKGELVIEEIDKEFLEKVTKKIDKIQADIKALKLHPIEDFCEDCEWKIVCMIENNR